VALSADSGESAGLPLAGTGFQPAMTKTAVVFLLLGVVVGHKYQLEQYDSLRVARCTAACWTVPSADREGVS
jgi:hypothetical protein